MGTNNDILLSIIIPVYNVEPYLRECMDSVLQQDLYGCEVVCVDDGSTDNSLVILEEYANNYGDIVKVFHKTNGGLSDARNYGVSVMRGKYIYFLDSDDYLTPFAISTIKTFLIQNPSADVLQFDNIVTTAGKRLSLFPSNLPLMTFHAYFEHFHSHKANSCTEVCCVSYSYSYSYWKTANLRFDKGLRYEDAMLLYRLCVLDGNIKMCHVEEPFYVYRVGREGSISTNVSMQHYRDRQYIWREADRLFKQHHLETSETCHKLFEYALWVMEEAVMSGYIDEAKLLIEDEDINLFKRGIITCVDRRNWLLLKWDAKFCANYLLNRCSSVIRRSVNIFFTYFDKICPNWLLVNTK